MMIINNLFDFGQVVYFKTDMDQVAWIITGIMVDPGGTIQYRLSCGIEASTAFEFELSTEKDYAL